MYEYEIEVTNEPDEDGHYAASVFLAKTEDSPRAYLSGGSFLAKERDAVIEKAKAYVAWHRDHDDSREVIRL